MVRFASTGVFYFSKKPLKIATTFGFLSVGAGLLLSMWILCSKLLHPGYLVSGWTSIILLVIYFGGVQLLTIGILGHYIGSLFDEVKRRPEYIVDEDMFTQTVGPAHKSAEILASQGSGESFGGTYNDPAPGLSDLVHRRVKPASEVRGR